MDNVTHTLAAAAMAKTGIGRASRLAPVAIVVAANAPDLDFAVRFFGGQAAFLAHHRGITHSLPGVVIQIPLLTTIFWAIEILLARKPRDEPPKIPSASRPSWWRLCLPVACGLATQPLFDWFNTYGMRPWLPFDGTWHYGDLAFIIDPWLWLLFGGAACLAGRRSRVGSVVLAAVGLLGCAVIWLMPRAAAIPPPAFLRIAWVLAVVALALARWKGIGRARPNMVVGVAAALSIAYLVGMGWAGRTAWQKHGGQLVAQFPPGEVLQRHMWSPQLANPLGWTLIAETRQAVYQQPVRLLEGPMPAARLKRHQDDPLVRAALATPDGRAWHTFARFPVAQILRDSPPKRVLLLDARYPVEPPNRNWCRMVIDLDTMRSVRPEVGRVAPD